jgi:Zn-dependent protease with chaperone function
MRLIRFLFLALLILSSCTASLAEKKQKRRSVPDVPLVPLPADYGLDLKLAASGHARMMMGGSPLLDTGVTKPAQDVFQRLVDNCFPLPYPWKLTIVNKDVVNASANSAGQVYAYGGMARLLGSDSGLWAAVLSHEIAHTAMRHQVQLYLQRLYINQQIQYYRRLAAAGDKAANWTLIGLTIAAPIALNKLSRDLEHQADAGGMLLMARSGYHPDLIFALHHRLRMATGEQSKLAAFFSDHPRWTTRDQRSERAYADALAEFDRRWPDTDASPGGPPPVIAFLGSPISAEKKREKSAGVTVPISCRNADRPIALHVHLKQGNREVGIPDVREEVACTETPNPVELRIPATLSPSRNRKFKAQVRVFDPDGDLIEISREFDVRIPRP